MNYHNDHHYLKSQFTTDEQKILLYEGAVSIYNLPFKSENCAILPGEDQYDDHEKIFSRTPDYQHAISPEINEILNLADSKVRENRVFNYSVFQPTGTAKAKKIIILMHGLNEKNWFKYLTWATRLTELTGSTVILFPIAFHMNRAPADWSDFRIMNDLKYIREGLFHAIVGSSFANVAISTRLHILPQRFFWSGLQTFYDILQLIRQIRSGNHPLIDDNAAVDFFAYSIGAFLAQVLRLANPGRMLDQSKMFLFCGGPVFNRMSPVRKSILDSEANIALYSFFIEHLENYIKTDKRLAHYFSEVHSEGLVFKAMLDYNKMLGFREEKLREISGFISAIALKKDQVVPSYDVLNTLKGADRDIPIDVKVMDFPFNYTHENPFPLDLKIADEVNEAFGKVFKIAADFLR
jgi:hypothetical protein